MSLSALPGDTVLRRLLTALRSNARSRRDAPVVGLEDETARLFDQAEACRNAADLPGAEKSYRQVLELEPGSVRALHLLGVLCARGGRLDEAHRYLERAVELDPASAPALTDLGQVLSLEGSHVQALGCFRQALALEPHLLPTRLAMAKTLRRQGDLESAVQVYRDLLDHGPVEGGVLHALIELLDGLGRHEEACAACEAVLSREPAHAQAHECLGRLLVKRAFDPSSGLRHLDTALALRPDDPVLHVTRAIALRDLARIDDAVEACDRALALDRGNPMARFHRAIARLLQREFAGAWPDYEARLASQAPPQRVFPYPRWSGEDLGGRTILVHAEQGIGDEIMFASCIPDLAAQAGRVVLECSEKLAGLFGRSFPGVTVKGGSQHGDLSWLSEIPGPDCVIPIGSLPLHFRNEERAFNGGKPYLHADARLIEEYRRRIVALGPGTTVGLSWRGGTAATRRALRVLDPAQLFPELDLSGVHWVNLQYDATAAEIDALGSAHGVRIHHWQDAIDDYDRTAALVSALDRVISVCTAVVHLGGALGTPVWVAAHRSPEWRYGIEGDTMPWYGSVRIFRQRAAGDWTDVIGRIGAELRRIGHEPISHRHANA